jgi:hypothetical protein
MKDGLKALFVMDNAAYHWSPMEDGNVSSWTLQQCRQYMTVNGIPDPQPQPGRAKVMRDDLKALCREHVLKHRSYWVLDIAKACGHYVLSLPPYHPGSSFAVSLSRLS